MPSVPRNPNLCVDRSDPHPASRTVSLAVLPPKVKKSKMGPRRAAVLVLVHLLFAAHVLQWYLSGKSDGVRETLSPIEPSEGMGTLKEGLINTGAIFFAAAILSTLILGRWFCGWGCHIVALQDFCGWLMKKLGVHPKPFRTRLLLWVPVLMAFYMFLWPAFHRWGLTPLFEWAKVEMPLWMGRSQPLGGYHTNFVVENFWATFPPWYVAAPFLFVCGFVTVYFLGAKGFCTYGCPYAGFFAPIDRFAPARIVVDDNCHQCGHCTAVCTSNVRVHEEVRDFGAVVDPGCMKCLDCVSVCPNGALSFGFAKPALLTRVKSREAAERRGSLPDRYDAPLKHEIWLLILFIAILFSIRGMLDKVPFLMAAGLGSLITYGVWKTFCLFTQPNVRAQNVQLKLKGRLRPAGAICAVLALLLLASAAWSAWVRSVNWRAEVLWMQTLDADQDAMARGQYTPTPEHKELAAKAISLLHLAGPPSEGGWGWKHVPERLRQLAWLQRVSGDAKAAQEATEVVIFAERAVDPILSRDLLQLQQEQGKTPEQTAAYFDGLIAAHPQPGALYLARAYTALILRNLAEARELAPKALYAGPASDPDTIFNTVPLMLQMGRPDESGNRDPQAEGVARSAKKIAEDAVALRPRHAELRLTLAVACLEFSDREGALRALREAARLRPGDAKILAQIVQILESKGLPDDAAVYERRLHELVKAAAR